MIRILAINGSYRDDGITDQVVEIMAEALTATGAGVEIVLLREYPVKFCLNCRECTQQPGTAPGECIQQDGMQELINKIENSDGYILAAPTNFGTVTAVFQRFMERLVVYGYWPWDMNAPQYRKANVLRKKAVLVSSCAAPGILGRWCFNSHKQLQSTTQMLGARSVGTLFTGMVAKEPDYRLSARVQAKARTLALKLI